MHQSLTFAFFLLFALFFITPSCSKKNISIDAKVTPLTDFQSADGQISIQISGGKAPFTISWSNGMTDTLLTGLDAGNYIVTITDKKNRRAIDTIEVTQPQWPICIDAEGNNYRTVVVANQIWMAENLRVNTNAKGNVVNALSLNNADSLDAEYGKLYTWNVAMDSNFAEGSQGICPDGWHIPSDGEWMDFIDNVSNYDKVIPNLEENLNLKYAGFYNGEFQNADVSANYWSSTQVGNNAWKQYFNKNLSKAFRYHEKKSNAISVRCVKNAPLP